MSEHGSNCSIEEIGPEELEEGLQSTEATPEPVNARESGDQSAESPTKSITQQDDDDLPLEVMQAVVAESVPVSESQPAASAADVSVAPAVEVPAAPAAGVPAAEVPAAAASVPPPPVRAAAPPAASTPSQSRGVVARRAPAEEDDEEEDDDDIDETLSERLIGLTEMFPESLRSATVWLVESSLSLTKSSYSFSRSAAWVVFSTATILFMPIMIETERLAFQDQQKQQKTQMLLGPGVGVSGGPALGPPPI